MNNTYIAPIAATAASIAKGSMSARRGFRRLPEKNCKNVNSTALLKLPSAGFALK